MSARTQLQSKPVADLRAIAEGLGLEHKGMQKAKLIDLLLAFALNQGFENFPAFYLVVEVGAADVDILESGCLLNQFAERGKSAILMEEVVIDLQVLQVASLGAGH